MLNPNGMIASVDTDKHVSSPEWNPADVHSLCRTSRALSVRFVGRLWYITSTFTSEGFWEIKPILGWHGVLSLQPVLCFSVSKGAGRGSDGLRCPCPPVSAPVLCSLTHSSRSLAGSTLRRSLSTGSMVWRWNGRLSLLMICIRLYCMSECGWGCLTHALLEHVGLVS